MKRTALGIKQPQRAVVVADEWVNGNSATDEPQPRTGQSAGVIARLTIDLPADTRDRFKAACALRRTRMVDEVRLMIDEWIQKHGKL